MSVVSETQSKILRFVEKFSAEHGFAPTLGDISAAVGMRSRSSAAYQIGQLERMGLVTRNPLLPRTIRLAKHAGESDTRTGFGETMIGSPGGSVAAQPPDLTPTTDRSPQ